MADPFIGEIRIFAFTFPPYEWAFCAGQQLAVQQNAALYSIIGTMYGGTSGQNFNLPNLQGRAPLGMGAGPGLTPANLAQTTGVETVALTSVQVAGHQHQVNAVTVSAANLLVNTPTNNTAIAFTAGQKDFSKTTIDPWTTSTGLASQAVGNALGNGQGLADPHENRQPYQPMNFCISLSGIYPVKP